MEMFGPKMGFCRSCRHGTEDHCSDNYYCLECKSPNHQIILDKKAVQIIEAVQNNKAVQIKEAV